MRSSADMPQGQAGPASLGTVHVVDDDPAMRAATTFLLCPESMLFHVAVVLGD